MSEKSRTIGLVVLCLVVGTAAMLMALNFGLLEHLGWEVGPIQPVDEPTDIGDTIVVVSSIHPLTSIIESLGGDKVETLTLLPPGANAHLYEITPAQMQDVTEADLLIRVGGGLDDWAKSAFGIAPDEARRIALTEAINSRYKDKYTDQSNFGENDWSNPHWWLDPLIVRDLTAPVLTEYLKSIALSHEEFFQERKEAFQQDLTELDEEITEVFAEVRTRRFLADHPAWNHFARRYALVKETVLQECTHSEPNPASIIDSISAAKDASVIVTTRGHDKRSAQTVADADESISLLEMDPIGDPRKPQRGSYVGLLRYNANRLRDALDE